MEGSIFYAIFRGILRVCTPRIMEENRCLNLLSPPNIALHNPDLIGGYSYLRLSRNQNILGDDLLLRR